jgi:hypothetical protein
VDEDYVSKAIDSSDIELEDQGYGGVNGVGEGVQGCDQHDLSIVGVSPLARSARAERVAKRGTHLYSFWPQR